MTEAQRTGLGRPAVIAISFAVVALLTSVIAVVVVVCREPAARAPVAANRPRDDRTDERKIDAREVLRLKRDVVEKVEINGAFAGVTIKDDTVRTAFGLEAADVITAINGRAIKREFDVFDAVIGMSTMNASFVYVEITRAGAPMLLRWQVEGELQTARSDPNRPAHPYANPNPFTAPRDVLVDSIKKLGDLHYEVPKATADALLANPDTLMRHARIVPAMAAGQPLGFRLYAIRPGSVWSAIGLANGDTIRSVNGVDLSTPDQALRAYATFKDARELRISVLRRIAVEDTIVVTIK